MAKKFNEIANENDDGLRSPVRALQVWQYLIGKAKNRQIVRYGELAEMMGYTDNRPLTPILACVMWYCQQNDLPPLTIIAVNRNGVPGEGFTAAKWDEYHLQREKVFEFDWFGLFPPSVDELREAWKRGFYGNSQQ